MSNASSLPVMKILGSVTSPLKTEIAYITPEDGIEFETQSVAVASIKTFVLDNCTTLEPLAESVKLTE